MVEREFFEPARSKVEAILSEAMKENRASPFCLGSSCADPLCPVHAGKSLRQILSQQVAGIPETPSPAVLASMIDHTLLKPDAVRADVRALCEEAAVFAFASVCVNPSFVPMAAAILKGTRVKVCTVVGFPLGATTTDAKVFESRKAMRDGAEELDMVMHVGLLKTGAFHEVRDDIASVVDAAHQGGCLCKVILETALLTDEEKIRASLLSTGAGADFVKTSTGFSKGGATPFDVALMRRTVGPSVGVKAAGGIRTMGDALTMIAHGANRIGTSSGPAILEVR